MEAGEKINRLWEIWEFCSLCPRECGAARKKEKGICGVSNRLLIGSWGPHPGEEAPLVGRRGSGTIFFAGCNLKCVYCQNYDLSHMALGREADTDELVKIMLKLEKMGCHNINLVTPTHVVPWIAEAILKSRERGLSLPVVYNCGGYESVEVLKLLEGFIDIYMPDIKYGNDVSGKKYSGVPDYFQNAKMALKEMHRQVGDLKIDERGIAWIGLLIRHLVLPGEEEGTRAVLDFLKKEISPDTYLNLMAQYYPAYRSGEFPELKRRISPATYRRLKEEAREKGFRLDR